MAAADRLLVAGGSVVSSTGVQPMDVLVDELFGEIDAWIAT